VLSVLNHQKFYLLNLIYEINLKNCKKFIFIAYLKLFMKILTKKNCIIIISTMEIK